MHVSDFRTVSRLDFSHLGVKGIELRSPPRRTTSADLSRCLPPADHGHRALRAPLSRDFS
jgi:hypothetical protein